jgi:hypothetical protein
MDELRSSSIMDQGYGNSYKKVLKDRRLTDKAKLIHCYLCSYAGGGNTAFPPVSLICYDLDITDDTYYEHMMYLKGYGYITAEQQQGKNGQFGHNIYTLEMYPEQHEDKEVIQKIIDKKESRKAKREKKKAPHPKKQGTDKTPTPDYPGTDGPGTDNSGTNNNSINNILFNIWNEAKELVKKDLKSAPAYKEFIEPLEPVECQNDTIIFAVPSDWHRMIIDVRYRSIIGMRLKELHGKEVNIVLRI